MAPVHFVFDETDQDMRYRASGIGGDAGRLRRRCEAPHRGARLIEPQNRVVVEREELAPSARAECHVVNERGLQGDRPDDGKQRLGLCGGAAGPSIAESIRRLAPFHTITIAAKLPTRRSATIRRRSELRTRSLSMAPSGCAWTRDANAHVARRFAVVGVELAAVLENVHRRPELSSVATRSARHALVVVLGAELLEQRERLGPRAGCAAPGRWPCRRSSCLRG